MNNKIVKNAKNTPVKMTRDVALERLEEAKELLKVSRPKEVNSIKSFNQVPQERVGLWVFSVATFCSPLVPLSLIDTFDSLTVSSVVTLCALGLAGLVGLAFSIGIPVFQTRELSYFDNDKKIRKMLSRAFLGKERQEILANYLKENKENTQAMKIYRLLVEKVTKELESSGVFEIVNDFNDPLNQSFVSINQSTGSFDYVSRRVIEDELAKKREKDLTLNYEKSMLEILSDDSQLLGQGRDFKEMF